MSRNVTHPARKAEAAGPAEPAQDLRRVCVIIPALNEAQSLRTLLPVVRSLGVGRIIVADNGSTDATARIARDCGAIVVREPRRGYGAACAAGLAHVGPECDVIAFLDADLADDPQRLPVLAAPVLAGRADLVIGCRLPELREPGAMTLPQRFGNALATALIRLGWGYAYRDLGPFRVIRRDALEAIDMQDRAFGWTVEMQVRAVELGLRIEQIGVPYRRRTGVSKISGTVGGVVRAGYWILRTLGGLYWTRRRRVASRSQRKDVKDPRQARRRV